MLVTMPRFKVKYILILCCVLVILGQYLGIHLHLLERDYYTEFHYPYDGEVKDFVHELRSGQRADVPPINYYNYSFINNCSYKCKNQEPRLVYIVKSSPEHFERRLAIRNSWGYETRFSDVTIKTVFVIGARDDINLMNRIKSESTKFKDIVLCDYLDNYFNNTIKTMMGFKWAMTYCPNSKFYMFVDDDFYVSTKNVLRFIRNPTNYPNYLKEPVISLNKDGVVQKVLPNTYIKPRLKRQIMNFELPDDVKLYAGFVFVSTPQRHRLSKWYVSLEEYPYHLWPPYVTAGSYIVSREALHEMYYTSFYTQHFRFDDIYLSLVALKAHIEPYHCEEFHFWKKPYDKLGYTYVITSHGYDDPNELLKVWNEQRSAGNA